MRKLEKKTRRHYELEYMGFKPKLDYEVWRNVCAYAKTHATGEELKDPYRMRQKSVGVWHILSFCQSWPDKTWGYDPHPLGCVDTEEFPLFRAIKERKAYHMRKHYAKIKKRPKRERQKHYSLFDGVDTPTARA